VKTREGVAKPVLEMGSWQVELPGNLANKAVTLILPDKNGRTWETEPFYPNHNSKDLKASVVAKTGNSHDWRVPTGVAVLLAAEPIAKGAAQQQAALKFNNYARPTGRQYDRQFYDWRVFVDESQAVLDTIQQIDYVLHPTFPNPFQSTKDRGKKFELIGSGWGGFNILITVHYTDGRLAKASYNLDLSKEWPTTPLTVTLDKIVVNESGSPGVTGWTFEILLNGNIVKSLPKVDYDDTKTNKKNEYAENIELARDLKMAGGQTMRVEVRGKRTFVSIGPRDTATGVGTLTGAGALTVSVKNPTNDKKGSFVFHLSAAAAP